MHHWQVGYVHVLAHGVKLCILGYKLIWYGIPTESLEKMMCPGT